MKANTRAAVNPNFCVYLILQFYTTHGIGENYTHEILLFYSIAWFVFQQNSASETQLNFSVITGQLWVGPTIFRGKKCGFPRQGFAFSATQLNFSTRMLFLRYFYGCLIVHSYKLTSQYNYSNRFEVKIHSPLKSQPVYDRKQMQCSSLPISTSMQVGSLSLSLSFLVAARTTCVEGR